MKAKFFSRLGSPLVDQDFSPSPESPLPITGERRSLSSKQNTATRSPSKNVLNPMFDYKFNKIKIWEFYYPDNNIDKVLMNIKNTGKESSKFVNFLMKQKPMLQKSVAPGSPTRRRVFKNYIT